MKKKPSELFEGKNSSLYKTFMTTNNKSDHETHYCCDDRLKEKGGQATCCGCDFHDGCEIGNVKLNIVGDSLRKQEEKSKCCGAGITCCNRCDTVICENPLCSKCKKPFEWYKKGDLERLLKHTSPTPKVATSEKHSCGFEFASKECNESHNMVWTKPTSEKKCDGSCYNLYICIYCHEEINVRIQPWDYFFPSQAFHKGCFKKCGNCSHGLCETCNKCHNVLENCPNSIYPSKNCFNSITKKPVDTPHESSEKELKFEDLSKTEQDYLHNVVNPTPHESEDWATKLKNIIILEEGQHASLSIEFVKELLSKVYQRGREEVEHCSEPKCPECNLAAYKQGSLETIRFAVQEIEKEKKENNYANSSKFQDAFLAAEVRGFNAGLDKAKSIISGLMKK